MIDEKMIDVVSVRLVKDAPIVSENELTSPDLVVKEIGRYLSDMDREVFCVLNMNTSNKPLSFHIVSTGALDCCIADPRGTFKAALLANAKSVILIHNHPSKKLVPSDADILTTMRFQACGTLLGIPVTDSIIVGDGENYYSMRENGVVDFEMVYQLHEANNAITFRPKSKAR